MRLSYPGGFKFSFLSSVPRPAGDTIVKSPVPNSKWKTILASSSAPALKEAFASVASPTAELTSPKGPVSLGHYKVAPMPPSKSSNAVPHASHDQDEKRNFLSEMFSPLDAGTVIRKARSSTTSNVDHDKFNAPRAT